MRRLLPALLLLSCEPAPEPIAERPSDPGRVTVHRLNRAEYDATVHDLLGTTLTPGREFPDDDFANGWDNMAVALSLSPLHLEMYERAAWIVLDDVLGQIPPAPESRQQDGLDAATFEVTWEGEYAVRVRALGQPGDPEMVVAVDGLEMGRFTLDEALPHDIADPGRPLYEVRVDLTAGDHDVYVSFEDEGRVPIVDWIRLDGPYDAIARPSVTRNRLLVCDLPDADPRACARADLVDFVPRAWRRPVEAGEIDALMGLFDTASAEGGTWEEALRVAFVATLVSPNFVFRIERDPDPASTEPRPLDGYELASRLSYFLWSSMPDDELFELAATGEILDDQTLQFQVSRMLADPRSMALVDNFAGQWLLIRAVDDVFPDPAEYPDFDGALQTAMKQEMRLYTKDILLGDRSMRDLLTAKEAWPDGRLARHYGIDTFGYLGPVRVDTTGYPRAGIVTTAGLLTVLSYPARTSPVKRGKWVMSSLLCENPPPPPPDVEGLPDDETAEDLSIREQMERHRSDPACATCHRSMDAIGFAFEHYDGIGAYRTDDERGHAIDSSGRLPDGTGFDDVIELMRPLSYSPKFSQCIVQKTFTYALGRAPTVEDVPTIEAIEAEFVSEDMRFEDLVRAIVQSEPFRWRRGEAR